MISESFKIYPNENLLGLSDTHYRNHYKYILFHTQVNSLHVRMMY